MVGGLGSRSRWWVGVLAFALVAAAWAWSNPVGAAPDEPSHYVRVVGLERLDLFGRPVPTSYFVDLGLEPGVKLRHLQTEAGFYRVPGSAQPPVFCNRFHPNRPFVCPLPASVPGDIDAISFHAATPPLTYVVPAVVALFGGSTSVKVYLARFAFAVQDALLFALLLAGIGRLARRRWSMAVSLLVLALPPLLLFEAGTIAPNGTETLAIAAFSAWLALAVRDHAPRDARWAAVLGAVACLTRDVSFLFVLAAAVVVVMGVPGGRAAWTSWTRTTRIVVVGAIGAGVVWGAVWHVALAGELGPLQLTPSHLWREIRALGPLLVHSVSLVGSLDVSLSGWTSVLWWSLFAVSVSAAAGRDRRRWATVAASVVAWMALNVVLSVTSESFGYGNQARYTLFVPLVLVVVLVASRAREDERERSAQWWRFMAPVVGAFAAAMQLAIIVVNGHRHANGLTSAPLSFAHPVWSPPGGWAASLVFASLAAVAWLLFPLVVGLVPSTVDAADGDVAADAPEPEPDGAPGPG